jgi:glycerol-3-phosphate O-acyltransferase/dihydroxyacetone phosphate acyltransferase
MVLWREKITDDRETAYAAQMAREILWEQETDLKLSEYVDVAQTQVVPMRRASTLTCSLVDIFTTSSIPQITELKTKLASYHRLLVSSRLSNAALVDIPLPQDLDPSRKVTLPNRFLPLYILIKDTISSLIRLPFFLLPLVLNIPLYVVGILGARLAEDEVETQAQTKIALALVLSFLMYPILFFVLCAALRQVPLGAALAAGILYLLRRYHSALVDENYQS